MNGTNWTNITNFEGLLTEVNRYAPFWTGMLYMIWFVLIITFLPYGTTVAVLGGSFLAFVLGIFFIYMNLIAWKWVLAILGVIIALIIWEAIFSKKDK